VTLELGGKSPLIVCEDADVDEAVATAHNGLFFNSGQVCCAGSRVLVHEKVYDEFVAKSVARAQARTLGDAFSGAEQGPQVDEEQHKKVLGLIETGVKEGTALLCGGGRHGDRGYFVQPTVFGDVKPSATLWQEEIFGPVMCIAKWSDTEEVIARANDTMYGLASAVLTKDLDRAITISTGLRAGVVWGAFRAQLARVSPLLRGCAVDESQPAAAAVGGSSACVSLAFSSLSLPPSSARCTLCSQLLQRP